jgi:hypothetical protein
MLGSEFWQLERFAAESFPLRFNLTVHAQGSGTLFWGR